MHKRVILFLMGLLVAACTPAGAGPEPAAAVATAVPTTQPTATGLMQVYENTEAGFSLRLPTDWTVGAAQEAPYGTVYLVGAAPLAPGGPANNSIIVADGRQITAVQLAEQLQCGGGCAPPALNEVNLRHGITAQYALIGGAGSPLLPWYFVNHDGDLVGLSFHDAANTEQSLDAIVQSLVFGRIYESGGEEMASLQAARQFLAEDLGVNPYALVMESITSTQWPDICLGVYSLEVTCAQVVTPGYAVTLSLREQLFQVNSSVDGRLVVGVPVSGAPGGGLSLTWTDGGCHLALVQPGSGVKSGPCDGPLTAYAFSPDTAEAAAQLDTMMARLTPFYAETAVGLLNVNGFGAELASPAQVRQLAELAHWLTETAVAGRSSAADHLAFSWHREGGIAGFCDDLAVYSTGLAQATSCRGTNVSAWLSNEQLAQLYDWRDTLQGFDFEQADAAGAADGLRHAVMFMGNGRNQPTETQKQAVLTLADAIFAAAVANTSTR